MFKSWLAAIVFLVAILEGKESELEKYLYGTFEAKIKMAASLNRLKRTYKQICVDSIEESCLRADALIQFYKEELFFPRLSTSTGASTEEILTPPDLKSQTEKPGSQTSVTGDQGLGKSDFNLLDQADSYIKPFTDSATTGAESPAKRDSTLSFDIGESDVNLINFESPLDSGPPGSLGRAGAEKLEIPPLSTPSLASPLGRFRSQPLLSSASLATPRSGTGLLDPKRHHSLDSGPPVSPGRAGAEKFEIPPRLVEGPKATSTTTQTSPEDFTESIPGSVATKIKKTKKPRRGRRIIATGKPTFSSVGTKTKKTKKPRLDKEFIESMSALSPDTKNKFDFSQSIPGSFDPKRLDQLSYNFGTQSQLSPTSTSASPPGRFASLSSASSATPITGRIGSAPSDSLHPQPPSSDLQPPVLLDSGSSDV